MSAKLHLSISPHIRTKRTTQSIMLDVIIALMPVLIAGCVIFGLRALAVLAVTTATAVLSEWVFNRIMKKKQTIGDLSAVVTGLLIGLNLPATASLWQAAIGSIFAIIVVKCLFGGLGCNLVNPAATARVFMLVAFSSMTQTAYPTIVKLPDAVASATPLTSLETGKEIPSLLNLFLGLQGGAIGETCTIALLIGFAYLLIRRVITWHIPVAYIGAAYLLTFLIKGFDPLVSLSWILSGGLIIGAIFMATDYVTSPATPLGKIIFGVGCALFTVIIRFWGNYPEGVSFAILLMNLVNPYIDKLTPHKLFGKGGKKA
jgi:electron transport complex protein RnfD